MFAAIIDGIVLLHNSWGINNLWLGQISDCRRQQSGAFLSRFLISHPHPYLYGKNWETMTQLLADILKR